MWKKVIGIYKITNLLDGKIYIGQSLSANKRMSCHRTNLTRGVHSNEHLQGAWNKHGGNNFAFTLIEECVKEKLEEREIYWILFYDSLNSDKGYNKVLPGDSSVYSKNRNYIKKDPAPRKPKERKVVCINSKTFEVFNCSNFDEVRTILGVEIKSSRINDAIRYWNSSEYNRTLKKTICGYAVIDEKVFLENQLDYFIQILSQKQVKKSTRKSRRKKSIIPYEKRNIKRIPIIIDGIEFASISEASKFFKVNYNKLTLSIRNNKVYKGLKIEKRF